MVAKVDNEARINAGPQRRAEADLPDAAQNNSINYAASAFRTEFRSLLENLDLQPEQLSLINLKSTPENIPGDYGFPCQTFAKIFKRNPAQIAQEFAEELNKHISPESYIAKFEAVGPYVNVFLNYERYGTEVTTQVLDLGPTYGSENIGQGAHVIVDFSSPNIAKRMSVAHLRSTVIGDSLSRIFEFLGYRVTKDNHIGDWGTNFGSIIYGIKRWGNIEEIESSPNPVRLLQKLYSDTYNAGKEDPSVKEAAQEWSLKLEQGDEEARQLWQKIVDWSLAEFQRVYDLMDIKFDYVLGESHYVDQIPEIIQILEEKGLAEESRGALVVDVGENKKPFMVKKSNSGSIYGSRDLATAYYRYKQLQAEKVVYVVGAEQKDYFEDLFTVLRKMELPIADNLQHVHFGLYTRPGGKMSTRKGRVVFLESAIEEAMERTKRLVKERKITKAKGPEAKQLIRDVAVGAVKWNDMMANPKTSIVFDMEKALSIEGKSAPYVQYTNARAQSILNQADLGEVTRDISPTDPLEIELVNLLAGFPAAVEEAGREYDPSKIVDSVYGIAQAYNALYKKLQILKESDPAAKNTRLNLTASTAQVIQNGLYLLGIKAPARM